MSIKELDKSYLNKLVGLNGLAFRASSMGKDYSSKGVKEYFGFTFKKGKVFGYFLGNKLVGCVGITIFENFSYGDVEHLLVDPKYRRRGIAKELMSFIEDYAKKKGLKGVRLSVNAKNSLAKSIYEKMGFKMHAYTLKKTF